MATMMTMTMVTMVGVGNADVSVGRDGLKDRPQIAQPPLAMVIRPLPLSMAVKRRLAQRNHAPRRSAADGVSTLVLVHP